MAQMQRLATSAQMKNERLVGFRPRRNIKSFIVFDAFSLLLRPQSKPLTILVVVDMMLIPYSYPT